MRAAASIERSLFATFDIATALDKLDVTSLGLVSSILDAEDVDLQ